MSNKNKIKVIGVDGNEANVKNRVGVNTYAFETLRAIANLEKEWKESVNFEIILREKPIEDMPKETDYFKYKILSGKGLWIIKTLSPYLLKHHNKYDLFWTPSHYIPPLSFTKTVCSVMDLGYLKFKSQFRKYDYYQLKIWTLFSLLFSKRIIAISDTTKLDVERHYPFTRGKVFSTLLGYDERRFNNKVSNVEIKKVKDKFSINNDYLLFLSTLKPSKNIEGLITAWSKVYKKFPNTKLIISGRKGWLFESIFEIVRNLNLENEIIFTDFVSEDEKPALIAGAKGFVLPSFWEGFGLDVLSSMACGVPVIVSNRGSLPEVVGNSGIIINPDNVDDLSSAITKLLSLNRNEYRKLSELSLQRARDFSWTKTAIGTINVLKSAL